MSAAGIVCLLSFKKYKVTYSSAQTDFYFSLPHCQDIEGSLTCLYKIQQLTVTSMILTDIFWSKSRSKQKKSGQRRPRNQIKLDPITEEDFSVSLSVVKEWSEDNLRLYETILENGMAEFICNKEYLYEFYKSLHFDRMGISTIDSAMLRFSNLQILSLKQNNISLISYLPPNCKELYVDFNQIVSLQLKSQHPLELFSASHNKISDKQLSSVCNTFTNLRCFNISYNQVCDLREFVNAVGSLPYLKVLAAFNNPISMLAIYYSYITDHLSLAYFDGAKYVKQEPKSQVKKEVVQAKKQEKEQKKQVKKDNKKGAKAEEKAPPQPPKVQEPPSPPPKKQLTRQDFERVKLQISITNLQNFSGNTFDSTLFPAGTDLLKTQTCYWIKYDLMGESCNFREKAILYESATNENNDLRINLQFTINKEISVNLANYNLFNEGLKVQIWQTEPKMAKDPQTLQLKPVLNENQVILVDSILGGFFIDFRSLHLLKIKNLQYKFRLFPNEALKSPLFYDGFEDEGQRINKKKQSFEQKLKAIEEEAAKKAQQQEMALQQKKGKDQKKGADKKAAKKDGKDAPLDKPLCEKCNYPIFDRVYCLLENEKMFKGKELACVSLNIL